MSSAALGPRARPAARPCSSNDKRRRRCLIVHAAAAKPTAASSSSSPPQVVVPAVTFEDAGEWLAERAVTLSEQLGRRAVVGIAGPPGGGKSTLATFVQARADELLRRRRRRRRPQYDGGAEEEERDEDDADGGPLAVVLPMDGFHYTRAQLDAFPDPAAAHARRGAPWTFDAEAFVAAVAAARAGGPRPVLAPSFDHAIKDPVADAIRISPLASVVIVEGNYLLLDEDPWRRLWKGDGSGESGTDAPSTTAQPRPPPPLLDEAWFVDAPLEAAMEHVFARQTGAGVGLSADESRARVEQNDAPNARAVVACQGRARVLVPGELPMRRERGAGGGGVGGPSS